jgi:heat shock protein HslJ
MLRLTALLVLTACAAPPLASLAPGSYRLVSINNAPFAARATISFAVDGMVTGNAPCNSYSGALTAALPRFATNGITSTEIGCDALADEAVFFTSLAAMTLAAVSERQVVLSNSAGDRMVFVQP